MINAKDCKESMIDDIIGGLKSPSDGDIVEVDATAWYDDFRDDELSKDQIAVCVESMEELDFDLLTHVGDYDDERNLAITANRDRIIYKDNGDVVYRYQLEVDNHSETRSLEVHEDEVNRSWDYGCKK